MSDLVRIPVPGGWLRLTQQQFEAAFEPTIAAPTQTPVELLDSNAAAMRLNVSARQLEDLARAGIIPCHRIGRFVRFDVAEVARHCAAPGAPIPGTNLALRAPPTDYPSFAARNALNGKAEKRRVSGLSPAFSGRDASHKGAR
jgi:excisionase family DNA binding protein